MACLRDVTLDLTAPEAYLPPRLVVGPRSFATDRISPGLELSVLPGMDLVAPAGRITGRAAPTTSAPFGHKLHRVVGDARGLLEMPDDAYLLDLRPIGMGNWSHALNQGLPTALKVAELLEAHDMPRPRVVLNPKLSGKLYGAFEALGFETVITRKPVRGPHVSYEKQAGNPMLRMGHSFLAPHLDRLLPDPDSGTRFGAKIFLNRRDNRRLRNDADITALLEARGFKTVYAEDWSLGEQLRLVAEAEQIVAIHGAALAPLQYRRAEDGPLRFVELLPVGHMVPFFFQMALHLPLRYVAVRGQIDRDMLPDLYRTEELGLEFTYKNSAKAFHIDPNSLICALDDAQIADHLTGLSTAWPFAADGATA